MDIVERFYQLYKINTTTTSRENGAKGIAFISGQQSLRNCWWSELEALYGGYYSQRRMLS